MTEVLRRTFDRLGRLGLLAVLALGSAFMVGIAAVAIPRGLSPYPLWIDFATQPVGLVIFGLGAAVWWREPHRRTMGALLTAMGLAWYLGDLQLSDQRLFFYLGFWLFHLNGAILAHVLLAYPSGLLATASHRLTAAALYLVVLITQGMRLLTERPLAAQIWGSAPSYSGWASAGSILTVIFSVVAAVLVVRRIRASPDDVAGRRLLLAVAVAASAVLASSMAGLFHASIQVQGGLLISYGIALVGVGVVVALSGSRFPSTNDPLRDALAKALNDPGLSLWYRLPGLSGYSDTLGRPAVLPGSRPGESLSYLGPRHAPMAALLHRSFLLGPGERRRLDATVAMTRLVIEPYLALARSAQQAEYRARREVGELVHDSLQGQLTMLQMLIGELTQAGAQKDWKHISDRLQQVTMSLREATDHIYPSALRRHNLADALDAVAQHAPKPLSIDIVGDVPKMLVDPAFFLIRTAVNEAMHLYGTTEVTVRVTVAEGQVVAEISDDRVATEEQLERTRQAMRVMAAAYGGEVSVTPERDQGVQALVRIPCGDQG